VRVAQEVVGVPHVDESDAVGGELKGEESQPTSHVDKLTNDGDSCLPPLIYHRVTTTHHNRMSQTRKNDNLSLIVCSSS
jgi:hypothetical protein